MGPEKDNRDKEVSVSVNWSEFERRVTKLRGDTTKILKITKEKLEKAAAESGLPVTFKLDCDMVFDDQKS